jgi:hypothetical protein
LRRLVDEYAPFRGRPAAALNNFEVAARGAMLHSFYNGVENILKRIAVTLDGALPDGDASHKQVLSQMAQPTARRGTVLSPRLCKDLKDYLNFRHVFRSAYSFHLRWEKMEPLVTGAGPLLDRLEAEIRKFLDQVPG